MIKIEHLFKYKSFIFLSVNSAPFTFSHIFSQFIICLDVAYDGFIASKPMRFTFM